MLEKHLRVTLDFKIKIDDITTDGEESEAQKQLLHALLQDEVLFRQFLEQRVVFEIQWLSEYHGMISETQQLHETFGIENAAESKILEAVVSKLDGESADYFKWAIENRDWSGSTTQFEESIKTELVEVDIEEL